MTLGWETHLEIICISMLICEKIRPWGMVIILGADFFQAQKNS
jgi:hypothetical protein